jgi:hypothetical protein
MADLYQAFAQGRAAGTQRRTNRTLSEHLRAATQGNTQSLDAIYAADPNVGMQAQKMARDTQSDSLEDVAKAAQFFGQTRDPKAYAYMHQRLSSMPQFAGLPATLDTPEDQEGAVKFAQAIAQTYGNGGAEANNVQSRFIDDQGNMVALMRDGSTKVVGKADANNQIIEGEGGFYGVNRRNLQAAPVQLGGGQPQMPQPMPEGQQITPFAPDVNIPQSSAEYAAFQAAAADADSPNPTGQPFTVGQVPYQAFQAPPGANTFGNGQRTPQQPMPAGQLRPAAQTISPAEQVRLRLAEEANARADREEQRKIQAGAVDGKPPNEGERAAFGYLGRMQAAEKLLTSIEGAGYEPGGYRDTTAANNAGMPILGPLFNMATSSEGQKYRQAQEDWVRAKLRKESGAVIGDEEMAREIRVYFAQPGDDLGVIQQKAAARQQAELQLRSMAGRAAATSQQARPGARPAGPKHVQSAADYDALPSGSLFIAPDGTQRRKR